MQRYAPCRVNKTCLAYAAHFNIHPVKDSSKILEFWVRFAKEIIHVSHDSKASLRGEACGGKGGVTGCKILPYFLEVLSQFIQVL